jgi:hypothetical protein
MNQGHLILILQQIQMIDLYLDVPVKILIAWNAIVNASPMGDSAKTVYVLTVKILKKIKN